jgi:hypothetical protein
MHVVPRVAHAGAQRTYVHGCLQSLYSTVHMQDERNSFCTLTAFSACYIFTMISKVYYCSHVPDFALNEFYIPVQLHGKEGGTALSELHKENTMPCALTVTDTPQDRNM